MWELVYPHSMNQLDANLTSTPTWLQVISPYSPLDVHDLCLGLCAHLHGREGEEGGISHQCSIHVSCSLLVYVCRCVLCHMPPSKVSMQLDLLQVWIPLTILQSSPYSQLWHCLMLHHYKAQVPALAAVTAHSYDKFTHILFLIKHHALTIWFVQMACVSGWCLGKGKRYRTRDSQGT